jgi:undecaprenyl-diphosphatase
MQSLLELVEKWDFILFRLATEVGSGWTPAMESFIRFRGEYLAWVVAIIFIAAPFVVGYIPWLKTYREKKWEVFWVGLVSAGVARLLIAEVVRFFYDRPRPFEVIEGVHQVIEHGGGGSFPSGHAAFFFTLATVISVYYPKTGIFFFASAILIGIARVSAGIHWPSDIVFGALIGIASGLLGSWVYGRYIRPRL